ncbi:4698_t:CDS:2, partial [Funneliformis caledonium]
LPKNRLEEDRWKYSESESSYKFEYQNGNVFIVDMCSSPRGQAVAALQYFFGLPNKGYNFLNRPIKIFGVIDHPSPNGGIILPDVAVRPSEIYVQKPSIPGPPTDYDGNAHARIICEFLLLDFKIFFDYLAILRRQGAKSQEWEFGTKQEGSDNPTGCVGPNLPAFLINIPISDVFYDPPIRAIEYVPLAPPINDGFFTIDL